MFILAIESLKHNFCRFPDEEAGEVPMACVVKRFESRISESQVMDYIAKQVIGFCSFVIKIRRWFLCMILDMT